MNTDKVQRKEPLVNNLVKWDRGWWHNVQSKQARVLRDWNWSVKHFILHIRFSKISQFRMILIRLKLHQFFNGVARTFSYTQAWASEEGAGIWKL